MSAGPDRAPAISVDTTDPTPPYEQVRRQVISLITSGALAPDDRLPPVRQLANDLGLAAGTVARSYQELSHDGWVYTKRGGGTRVEKSPPSAPVRAAALADLAATFVQRARFLGADDAALLTQLKEALSR
jgi:DNA-binding transcriptional regulator YhcF (GntR family)